jgi:integrase
MRYKYESVLHQEFNDYLELRSASGRKDTNKKVKYTLDELDRFLVKNEQTTKTLTEDILIRWLQSMDVKPSTRKRKVIAIRGLAKYLSSLGIEACDPELPRETYDYVPYIFLEDELARIIYETDNLALNHNISGTQAAVQMPVLIRLLYGCGLRLGEALALCWDNVDFNSGTLLIIYSKNEKQRIVPMSDSLTEICKAYRYSGLCRSGETDYLFGNRKGVPYSQVWVEQLFTSILQRAGIEYVRSEKYERGPCLHCFRHLFVLRSFAKAESAGRAFIDSVPYLSTYLGHSSIMETDKYLKFSYEMYPDAHDTISAYTKGIFPKAVTDE